MKTTLEQPRATTLLKQKTSGAEAVVKCLLAEGVGLMYGYPGGAIMPVYDALFDYENQLKHVLVRHEQAAIHAAQGYARVTKKVGVCMATSGPGATNLLTGIADAMIDSTPVVCITGQVASPLLGTDAFQETDVVGISMPVTKWNVQVTRAEDIPMAIARAFYVARNGRPGPVLVDITKDAQFGELDWHYEPCAGFRSYLPVREVKPKALVAAAELINDAQKPLVLVGHGVTLSGAEEVLEAFLEKTGMPAACTLLGLSALRSDHPNYTGMLGMHGNYAPNKLTNDADLIFAVGMRFDDRVTGDTSRYAKNAKVIHLDVDPSEIDKIIQTDVALVGDACDTLTALLPLVKRREHPNWRDRFHELEGKEFNAIVYNDLHPTQAQMTMAEVVHHLSDVAPEAVLVTDVGQHQMVASRYFKFRKKRSYITSGGLGTMGFALPAAMGAQMGRPDETVVAIMGDGGFQMTLQELGTIAQQKLPVKMIILNNEFLGMVRQWQELFFDKRYTQTEMWNPDFPKIASGYGIPGETIGHRDELQAALKRMLETDGPYLLEVRVKKEGNVFPMIPTGAAVHEIRLQ